MQREPAYQIQRNCFWIEVRLPTVEGRREQAELFVLWWDGGRGDFAVESLQGHIHQGEDRSCVRLACNLAIQGIDGYVDETDRVGIECRGCRVWVNGAKRIPHIKSRDGIEEPIHAEVSVGLGTLVVSHQPQKLVPPLIQGSSCLFVIEFLGTVRRVWGEGHVSSFRCCRTPPDVGGLLVFEGSEASVESADVMSDFGNFLLYQVDCPAR